MGRLPLITARSKIAALTGVVPTCVLDVRLSLGSGGLFWVMGLSRSLPVWLVQTHWSIVEDPYYLGQDQLVRWLAGKPNAPIETCRAAVAQACEAWREARRGWSLETCPNLFWSADRLAEAVVPKDRDIGLVERRDALAAGLDQRCGRSPETVDSLADCARDVAAQAVALAAATVGAPPFVLTTLAEDEGEPALVRTLNAAGVLCRHLEDGSWPRRFDETLAPALVEAGLATALAAGVLRLAAVQIVAPEALGALPTEDALGDTLGWNAAAQGDEARLSARSVRRLLGGPMRDLTENWPEARSSGHDGMICECRRCRARGERYVERLADQSLGTALRHAQDPWELGTEDAVVQLLEADQTADAWEELAEGDEAIYGAYNRAMTKRSSGDCGCQRRGTEEEMIERLARESASVALRHAQDSVLETSAYAESVSSKLPTQESVCLAAVIDWDTPLEVQSVFDVCFNKDCSEAEDNRTKCILSKLGKERVIYQFIRKSDEKILYTGRATYVRARMQQHCKASLSHKGQVKPNDKASAATKVQWEIANNRTDLQLRIGKIRISKSILTGGMISCAVLESPQAISLNSLLAATEKLYHSFSKEEFDQANSDKFDF